MNLSQTVRLLGNILGQVLTEQESEEIFRIEEEIRSLSKQRRADDPTAADQLSSQVQALTAEQARAVASAFALYFDLVNLAEENDRVSNFKAGQSDRVGAPESIQIAVERFKQRGVPAAEVQAMLDRLEIELVLTAHPTQAKRRSLMSKLVRISGLLKDLTGNGAASAQDEDLINELYAEVSAYWLTERARTAQPQVADEVRTGLYFVDNVFWEVLPEIYQELEEALREHYPGVVTPERWLGLASWIGGDRDGNPNVTYPVTAETLRLHRGLAIEKHRKFIQDLARKFTFSEKRFPAPVSLTRWFKDRQPLPEHVAFLASRYEDEPYRLVLSLLAADLKTASQESMTRHLLADYPHQAHIHLDGLTTPVGIITRHLPDKLGKTTIQPLEKQLHIFGLHAARLDIREDSARINAVVGEILRALDLNPDFSSACAEDRTDFLTQLLDQPPDNLADRPGVTVETVETWSVFKLIRRAQEVYGKDLFGAFVISMAQCPADVLSVLLLSRWAGCQEGLNIAPLFETVDDLRNAADVLRELFEHQAYRQHLSENGDRQMVMIGYSDSNKDAGYLSANWNLYQAQEEIAALCREYGIKLTLFHGRGGTVARGGGPANQAILAQPPGTINGRFRLTEQGETIASRYSNPDLAYQHLEQVVSAVICASLPEEEQPLAQSWRGELGVMSKAAQAAYRGLVYQSPGFMQFWQQVTPIHEITQLRIGSRPAARQPGTHKVTKIRAIPWVFSWMQSRFNLPGWFGLGTGLHTAPSLDVLQEMYARWPFFRTILDNAEMSLQKADLEIARLYLTLAEDQQEANTFYEVIREEFERTKAGILAITGHANLLDTQPGLLRSIQLRNPYIDPLNFVQVETLHRLRALEDRSTEEAKELQDIIVLTINGIASGLRNTG